MQQFTNSFQYGMPTKIIFGVDTFSQVGDEAAKLGNHALIVTGRSAMKRLGLTDKLIKQLKAKDVSCEVFDEVPSNPGLKTVRAGVKLCERAGCNLVIALGGGSAMDAAKAIACSAGLKVDISDLIENPIEQPGLPFIAIPTTSGTGAEVTHISVLTVEESNHKIGFRTPYTYPTLAIVDPSLTTGLPPYITANTGMDALTHAIEAYTSKTANPASDVWATRAIELVGKYLPTAVHSGSDLAARAGMALASTMAGVAISQAGTGAAHGVGMTAGGVLNCDHGTVVGLALPAVIRFNLEAQSGKFAHVTTLLGAETEGLDHRQAAEKAASLIEQLLCDLKLPTTLRELGADPSMLSQFMEDTKKQKVWGNNPRQASWEEIEQLFSDLM